MRSFQSKQRPGILWLLVVLLLGIGTQSALAVPASENRATASVSGEVFMDRNLNAIREPFEVGVAGARVLLLSTNGEFLAESATDEEGYYVFSGLAGASYKIQIFAPSGYVVPGSSRVAVDLTGPAVPLVISTPLRHGLFIPLVNH